MLNYFFKRLGLMLVTFLITVFLIFAIIKMLPTNYKPPLWGEDPQYWLMYEREGWGLPIPQQFFLWIKNIFLYNSFGYSYIESRDVSNVLFGKIPATMYLNIVPMILSIPIGIGLGILAALKKNKLTDHIISTGVIFFISVPTFVVATLAQYLFVWEWKLLPTIYVATPSEWADPIFGITTYILPVTVMTIGSIAGWTRSLRAELSEQLTQDFMLLARSKGLTHSQATFKHALRNAMVPFAPSLFLQFIGLLSGSMIMEKIFRVDGVGEVYLKAFNGRDYPMLMMVVVFYQFIGLVSAILADLSYSIVDPRMRVGSGKQ